MKVDEFTRRGMLKAGLTAAATGALPMGMFGRAWAATEEEGIIEAAKAAGGADLTGMIWSLYYRNMAPIADEVKTQAGNGVGTNKDISEIGQEAWQERVGK